MPNIPGASNLGQGIPGGRAGLPASLTAGVPGLGSNLGSLPRVSPEFNAPALPSVGRTPVDVGRPTSSRLGMQPTTKAYDLASAMQILDKVNRGELEWQAAHRLLSGIPEDEKRQLGLIITRNHAQRGGPPPTEALRAIGALPGGKDPGLSAEFDPSRQTGVGTNFVRDVAGAVAGAPAGIGLAAQAAGKDIANLTIPGHKPTAHTFSDILKPIGEQYAQTYGPLVHGDVGEFKKRLAQHPLGPILDLLSVASAGIGTAGRVGEASRAIQLGRVERLAGGAKGVAKVGDNFTVHQWKNGTYGVRQGNKWVASKLPDEQSAIKAAQSLSTGGLDGEAWQRAVQGYMKGGSKGSLIDAYEKARGITHEAETQQIMEEVAGVLDNPNLRMNRRTVREVARGVASDLRQTRMEGRNRPAQMAANLPSFISPTSTGRLLATGETALREASDLVRAGAIYLRPAYLPNNWAGNTFMNLVQQGAYAPLNLAKSLAMDKNVGVRYTRAIDQSMGQTAAEVVTAGKGRGYIGSITNPVAHTMGTIADQPFRRAAWLHEARRAGYGKLSDVQKLFDRASTHATSAEGEAALREIANISRKAQEEIVKFGHMNDIERGVLRNLVFVYSWMRGAGRYAARFPFQHPIQTAAYTHMGQLGNEWLQKEMGGVPSFLVGAIPVGRDSKGNPILINPFSLNPLGTGMDIVRAAAGTAKVISDPSQFNKYAQQDVVGLLNPLAQSYLQAREGGKPVADQTEKSIAALRLKDELQHPGSGSIYPTSRKEAIGHFVVGTLYPRKADQQAITRSLERENQNNPAALIPNQVAQYKKTTGEDVPREFIDAYKADLVATEQQKDFQKAYAKAHGQSGFRSLPPQNQAEAAIEYLQSHRLVAPTDVNDLKQALTQMTTDAEFKDFANGLWNSTGAGGIKRAWDDMMRDAKTTSSVTRKR